MKQESSVEWLIQKLEEEELIFNHGLVQRWKDQAKVMEREQRINDINFGHSIPSSVNINYEAYFKLERNYLHRHNDI